MLLKSYVTQKVVFFCNNTTSTLPGTPVDIHHISMHWLYSSYIKGKKDCSNNIIVLVLSLCIQELSMGKYGP